MPNLIESVHIRGFRSLADVKIDNLPRVAMLIGANGSGKSNIVRFFEMVSWMIRAHRLELFVSLQGGPDDQLFCGGKISEQMNAELAIRTEAGRNDYRFTLMQAHKDRFVFVDEAFRFNRESQGSEAGWTSLGSGHTETKIVEHAQSTGARNSGTARVISNILRNCSVYQFHDTSKNSRIKMKWDMEDNAHLRSDGGNLAAILLRLKQQDICRFELICRHIRRVLPVFDQFQIKVEHKMAILQWNALGIDKLFGAHLTSDGSLRLFALVTLLNLPPEMLPNVLILDEPELGLHPAAISLVGGMIKSIAVERQVIAATQSPLLVDEFGLDEILVLELRDGRTEVCRYDEKEYLHWLEEFTTGELWQKNLFGGGP